MSEVFLCINYPGISVACCVDISASGSDWKEWMMRDVQSSSHGSRRSLKTATNLVTTQSLRPRTLMWVLYTPRMEIFVTFTFVPFTEEHLRVPCSYAPLHCAHSMAICVYTVHGKCYNSFGLCAACWWSTAACVTAQYFVLYTSPISALCCWFKMVNLTSVQCVS